MSARDAQFGSRVTILGENSGMHLMVRLRTPWSNEEVIRRAAAVGVGLLSACVYYLGAGGQGEFVIAYAMLSERRIQEGVRRLAKALAC